MDLVQIEKINEVYNKIIAEPSLVVEMAEYFTFDVPKTISPPQTSFTTLVADKSKLEPIRTVKLLFVSFSQPIAVDAKPFAVEKRPSVEL